MSKHAIWYVYVGKNWHLYTFDSFSSLIRQNEILKFLEKSAFFNEENTNELDPMLKSCKIHFFSNLSCNHEFLGYESGRYVKKLDFFSIFRIFNFSSILTTFDPVLSRKREVPIWKFVKKSQIRPVRFLLKTRSKVVKIDQNLKIFENWEKMHFFHISITFVA